MKLNMTKEWFALQVKNEDDLDVGAGPLALGPASTGDFSGRPGLTQSRLALGPLVQLTRRKRGMSPEQLAQAASVELAEVVSIERDPGHTPEPRTVYQLAKTLNLPSKGLLQLSGNVVIRDAKFRDEAVRFAARSGSVEKLTAEERTALEEFVAFLSKQP